MKYDPIGEVGARIQAMAKRRARGVTFPNDEEQLEALLTEAARLARAELEKPKR